jgi:hypothetical protein
MNVNAIALTIMDGSARGDKLPSLASVGQVGQELYRVAQKLLGSPDIAALIASFHEMTRCTQPECEQESVSPASGLCVDHKCSVSHCDTAVESWQLALCTRHASLVDPFIDTWTHRVGFTFGVLGTAAVVLGLAATREAVTSATCSTSSDEFACFLTVFVPFCVSTLAIAVPAAIKLCRRDEKPVSTGSENIYAQYLTYAGGCCGLFLRGLRLPSYSRRIGIFFDCCAPLLLGISLTWLMVGAQALDAATALDDRLTSSDEEAIVMVVFGAVFSALSIVYIVVDLRWMCPCGSDPKFAAIVVMLKIVLAFLTAWPTILCALLTRSSPRSLIHAADVALFDDANIAAGYSAIPAAGCFLAFAVMLLLGCIWKRLHPVFLCFGCLFLFTLVPAIPGFLTFPALYEGRVPRGEETKYIVGIILGSLFTSVFPIVPLSLLLIEGRFSWDGPE